MILKSAPTIGFYRFTIVFLLVTARMQTSWAEANHPLEVHSVTIDATTVTLPPPLLPDGLDAAGQELILKRIAGQYPLDRFLTGSINSPFTLRRKTIENADKQPIGFELGLWFVAQGNPESIRSEGVFAKLMETKRTDHTETRVPLTDAELASRNIVVPQPNQVDTDQGSTAYFHFSAPVIDRVIVEGVLRGTFSKTEESYRAGVTLDETFADDAEYPNRWQHIAADQTEKVPYSGFTAYAKATELLDHKDLVLIECHAVIHEPQEWFAGTNVLSSKLPLAVQTSVRRFRRSLIPDAAPPSESSATQ